MSESRAHPESPCVRLCVLNPATDRCEGCGRTLDQIARWSAMSAEEKWAVLDELESVRKESNPNDD